MYIGEWKTDKHHGFGSFMSSTTTQHGSKQVTTASTWVGQWKEGEQHGRGLQYSSNGFPSIGIWRHGRPVGKRYATTFKDLAALKFFERKGNLTSEELKQRSDDRPQVLYSNKRGSKEKQNSGASYFFRFFRGLLFIEYN